MNDLRSLRNYSEFDFDIQIFILFDSFIKVAEILKDVAFFILLLMNHINFSFLSFQVYLNYNFIFSQS